MKTVYLVRHGESTENTRSTATFLGSAASLTELGLDQARLIAGRATRLPIDVILTSTYERAKQTAAIVSEATGTQVVESDLFVEHIAPSSFVGREWNDELRTKFKNWQAAAHTHGAQYEDGDTFDTMLERAKTCLKFLEAREEEHIFVVTHGMFSRVLVGLVMLQEDFSPQALKKMEHTLITRNTGITLLRNGSDDSRKDAKGWHMLTWNDHAHLG
jgi:probable phosphoglycerate mutase